MDEESGCVIVRALAECSCQNISNAIRHDINHSIILGEILLERALQLMGISQNAIARAIGEPSRAVNETVLGKRTNTPTVSIRFGAFFGQSEAFWHGSQVECDFRSLKKNKKKLTKDITPSKEVATA